MLYILCHFCLIAKSQTTFEINDVKTIDVRLKHIVQLEQASGLISFSTIEDFVIAPNDTLGQNGGGDLLLARLDGSFAVTDYLEFGSASDDEVQFIQQWGEDIIVGGLFWDSIHINNSSYFSIGQRGAFVTAMDHHFNHRNGMTFTSDGLVRLGKGHPTQSGEFLISGWCTENLSINGEIIRDDFSGIFLIHINADFSIVSAQYWSVTDDVYMADIFSFEEEFILHVNFRDSLVLSNDVILTTRTFQISNSALLKIDNDLNLIEYLQFKSTFSNNLILEKESESLFNCALNYRGNLEVGNMSISGLPLSNQAIIFEINSSFDIVSFEQLNSSTGISFSALVTNNETLFAGRGLADHWTGETPVDPWLSANPVSAGASFALITGDDFLFDHIFQRGEDIIVAGVFRGTLRLGEDILNHEELSYRFFRAAVQIKYNEQPPSDLRIIPNPVSDEFSILPYPGDVPYTMYGLDGRIIQKGILSRKMNISSLLPGIYLMQLNEDTKTRSLPTIVKLD